MFNPEAKALQFESNFSYSLEHPTKNTIKINKIFMLQPEQFKALCFTEAAC